MAEEAPAPSAAPIKAAKKVSKPTVGSSVRELIVKSVAASQERSGVSLSAVKKSLIASGYDVEKNNSRVKQAVKALVANDTLVQVKGTGASGSFKINKKVDSKAKKPLKKAVTKVKKPAAKTLGAVKKPQTAPKKALAAKKSPKKVKKPLAAKKVAKSPKKTTKAVPAAKKAPKKVPAAKKVTKKSPAAKKAPVTKKASPKKIVKPKVKKAALKKK